MEIYATLELIVSMYSCMPPERDLTLRCAGLLSLRVVHHSHNSTTDSPTVTTVSIHRHLPLLIHSLRALGCRSDQNQHSPPSLVILINVGSRNVHQ